MEADCNEPQPQVRPFGRDEMNLAEFPIALLSERAPKGKNTIIYRDGEGVLTITGSDAYGLPTAADSDVIVGLIQLTKEANDFTASTVAFTRYGLLDLLGWPKDGPNYRRLEDALKRWASVTLNYERAWWDNQKKSRIDATFHILETVVIAEAPSRRRDTDGGQQQLPLSSFTWNKTFFESCRAGNLKRLDLETYFSLTSAVSKQMYRFLDKRFYQRPSWAFDLREFAFEHVGLGRNYPDNGIIKKKLERAIEELEAIGFLERMGPQKRFKQIRRGQWTITLTRKSAPAHQQKPEAQGEVPEQPTPEFEELLRRGVTKATAVELVAHYPPERITTQLEYLDWNLAQGKKKISDPAAYLVKAIQKDYAAPNGFVSKAQQAEREDAEREKRRQAEAAKKRQDAEQARERAVQARILKYWNALSLDEQKKLEAEALDQAEGRSPAPTARCSQSEVRLPLCV